MEMDSQTSAWSLEIKQDIFSSLAMIHHDRLFSVITVCRNAATVIERTLQSVCSQSCSSFEYIVIDGESTDETLSVIARYKNRVDVLVSEKDKGIYNAMNKGLRRAHGKYVIFMNAGDCFADKDVLTRIESCAKDKAIPPALIYGDYMRVRGDEESQVIPARSAQKAWYGMFASHQSMFYNIDYLRENNLEYDESYKIAADYKLTLEVVHRAGIERALQVPVCVSKFELGGVSHSNQNRGLKEADRVRKEVLGMSALGRFSIRMMQYGARLLRENKLFRSIYSLLRY